MALTDKLTAIADAIRAKNGTSATMTLDAMPAAIEAIVTGGGVEDTLQTYSQMNTQAAAYLAAADAAYTDSNSPSVTVMTSYQDAAANWSGCAGFALNLTAPGTLHLMDETQPERSWKQTVSAGTRTVYNLIPGHTYRWLLVNASGETVQNGKLKATGLVRMIRLSYMRNVRDMGGWPCAAGTVQYGLLYRGMTLTDNEDNFAILRDRLGIAVEVDLRDDSEAGYITGSLLGDTVEYCRYPLETGYKTVLDYSGGSQVYRNTRAALMKVMERVSLGVPIYLHCAIGSDRTGVFGFLIGALLGMSRVDIDKNYELSSLSGKFNDSTDLTGRLRTRTDWNNMVNYLVSLGGSNPQENVVSWCARVGIPAKLINRFRRAMCSGTPETISYDNTITHTLANAAISNSAASVVNGGSYSAVVTADAGAALESVTITMAGEDITHWARNAQTGEITIEEVLGDIVITAAATYNAVSVTLNLTNVTASNTNAYAVQGQSYTTALTTTPDKRFQSVSVSMGGADVTDMAYNSETRVISIGKVTGDVVITAAAELIPLTYTNQIPISQTATGTDVFNEIGYMDNTHISSAVDSNGESEEAGFFATGFIPCVFGKASGKTAIYVRGADWASDDSCRLGIYGSSKAKIGTYAGNSTSIIGTPGRFFHLTVLDAAAKYWKIETVMETDEKPAIYTTMGAVDYIRFSLPGSGAGVIVTVNEPIE